MQTQPLVKSSPLCVRLRPWLPFTSSVYTVLLAPSAPDLVSDMSTISVNSFSAGTTTTQTTTSNVTTKGEFTISNFDPSSFNAAQTEEAKDYFENTLTQELENQEILPEGASVVVTGLGHDGLVQYEIHFYGTSSAKSSTAITTIESSLSQTSTLTTISSTVQAESATSLTAIAHSLSSVSIAQNTQVGTTGPTMTTAEEEETNAYFIAAITLSIGSDFFDGLVVTVTGIENRVVSYEITMNAGSSEDASTTVASTMTSLADASTLTAITASVTLASLSSSNPTLVNAVSGVNVLSNTAGNATKLTVTKVTSDCQVTTNLSGLTPAEVTEASANFEDAMPQHFKQKVPCQPEPFLLPQT